MIRFLFAGFDILAAFVVILPVYLFLNRCVICSKSKAIGYLIFSGYLVSVLSLVGFPNVETVTFDWCVNLVPLFGIWGNLSNFCLNVLLFVPFGIFLPILWEPFRCWKRTLFAGLIFTCGIELAQIFSFRITDVNNILANCTGTLLGFLILRGVTKGFSRVTPVGGQVTDLYGILGFAVAVMFFVQPFISNLVWKLYMMLGQLVRAIFHR